MGRKRVPQSFALRLLEAVHAVPAIEKLGSNEQYSYVRACDVFQAFRGELKKNRILLFSDEKEVIPRDVIVAGEIRMREITIRTDFILRDCDSEEEIKTTGFGQAMDEADKALYKAKTGALKYFLRSIGVIPWLDVDDPEASQLVNDLTAPVQSKKVGKTSAKQLSDRNVRAFASACMKGGKTLAQQVAYLEALGVKCVEELSPEQWNEAIKWAYKNGDLAKTLEMSKPKKPEPVLVTNPESQAGD